jgi:hypothetical protein
MQLLKLAKTLFTGTTIALVLACQSVTAQLPPVVDSSESNNDSQPGITIKETQGNSPQITNVAATSLRVSCQDLKTVVQKGDHQAVLLTWGYDGFGKEYTPEKRCQIVSERLQKAANINGGTFKNLKIASGTVNSLAVICAIRTNSNKCNRQNMLFTLKPENARNPEAVIQKIFSFARDGSSSIDESATQQPSTVDTNLGNWEQQAFPQVQRAATIKPATTKPKAPNSTAKPNTSNTGF